MSDVVVGNRDQADIVEAGTEDRGVSGFHPYIPAGVSIPEFTPLPLIVGILLGVVFGAASLYLVLKVGLTVSASIPAAVISITLFRLLSRFGLKNATILQNNIARTAGSAGESIAFGVGVTMPALMILGLDLEVTRVILVAVLGGLLGLLMMIPLRWTLIVAKHGALKYPEGSACAEVLKAGAPESRTVDSENAGYAGDRADDAQPYSGAKIIFTGFGIGLIYQAAMRGFNAWKEAPALVFGSPFKGASIAAEVSPALLGVGYIIGPRTASIMCAGGVLTYLVLIPAIKFFGSFAPGVIPPGALPISLMSPDEIRGAYVLYIGAGAVAAGGIISFLRSLPLIWTSLLSGIQGGGPTKMQPKSVPRTDRDLSMRIVLIGLLGVALAITFLPSLQMNLFAAILTFTFAFLFVHVSSRLTGEIGSTSNPVSGMTVATLLLTCLIFLVVGWSGPKYYVTALSVGAIVCIAASSGGNASQDLKTGFLIGSTPRFQQLAILVGILASALTLGPILLRLNVNATVYAPRVTFTPITPVVPLQEELAASLPAYAEEGQPPEPGSYRVLGIEGGVGRSPAGTSLEPGEYLVDPSGGIKYRVWHNFPPNLRVNVSQLHERETVAGAQAGSDTGLYYVWRKMEDADGPSGRYLVNDEGTPVYLVDPGINGTHTIRPDGSVVQKLYAPKAVLAAYIIKGILNRQLPWGLVLLGVMIAVVLEMLGVPSLPFAVGVYLPLSSSSPILIGGMIRPLVDKVVLRRLNARNMAADEAISETDKGPGVLMASGYIAGSALAAIVIAFVAGALPKFSQTIEGAIKNNPFFVGPYADVLSLIPFIALMSILYLTGRGSILSARLSKRTETEEGWKDPK